MADLAHAIENDNDLIGDLDAAHWAERFVTRVCEHPGIPTDEGAMLAWFAGCIEGTRDAVKTQMRRELEKLMEVQGRPGNWDYSGYMRGLYNGLECARATVVGTEPSYRDKPPGGYREDRAVPIDPDAPENQPVRGA